MIAVAYEIYHASDSGLPIHRITNILSTSTSSYYEANEETVDISLKLPAVPVIRIVLYALSSLRVKFELFHASSLIWAQSVAATDQEKVNIHLQDVTAEKLALTISRNTAGDSIKVAYLVVYTSKAVQEKRNDVRVTTYPVNEFYGSKKVTLKRTQGEREKPKKAKKTKGERENEVEEDGGEREELPVKVTSVARVRLADQPVVSMFHEALIGFVLTTTAVGEHGTFVQEMIEALGAVYMSSMEEDVKICIVDDKLPSDEVVREARAKGVMLISWHWLFQCQEMNRAVDHIVYSLE